MNISSWFGGVATAGAADGLQSSGSLSRTQFLQFAQLCVRQFDSPEYRQGIRDHFESGKPADDYIEVRQMALFEDLGVQGAFGIAQLATIQRRFGNDSEAMQALSLLVQREDAVLSEVELPAGDFAAKQRALQLMQAFQQRMATYAAGLDEDGQSQFGAALSAAMAHAASQVPQQERASLEEGEAAMVEQLRLTADKLRAAGFAVPDVPPDGGAPGRAAAGGGGGGGGVAGASSALSEEEQRRFLQRMQPRQ